MRNRDRGAAVQRVKRLQESLRTKPGNADLWADLGDLLTETGRFELAVQAFDVALQLDSDIPRARIGLAIALEVSDTDLSERAPPKMRTSVWESLRALDEIARGLRGGRPFLVVDVQALRVEKTTRRRLAENPNDPDALFLQSAILAKQGAFEEAITLLDRLAGPDVDYPGAARFREQLAAMAVSAERPAKDKGVPRP